jgi:antitoxin component YwqK of YwqJK toxin-antitoxin module
MKIIALNLLSYLIALISLCFDQTIEFQNSKYIPIDKNAVQIITKSEHTTIPISQCVLKRTGLFSFDSVVYQKHFSLDTVIRLSGKTIRGKAQGEWTFYDSNGIKTASFLFKNGIMDGKAKYWFETGELKNINFYCNNKNTGPDTQFYKNGSIFSISSKIDGKFNGKVEQFYENGIKSLEMIQKNNKVVGLCSGWHSNGNKKLIGMHNDNGEKNGDWTYWDSTGKLLYMVKYENGDSISSVYYNKKTR